MRIVKEYIFCTCLTLMAACAESNPAENFDHEKNLSCDPSIGTSEINIVSDIKPDTSEKNSGNEPVACTPSWDPGIRITVFDYDTGDLMCGINVKIEDGEYIENRENVDDESCFDGSISGAFERRGTYNIKVSKPGYIQGEILNVPVTSNICHVNLTRLEVHLKQCNT